MDRRGTANIEVEPIDCYRTVMNSGFPINLSIQDRRDLSAVILEIAGILLLWWRSRSIDKHALAAHKWIKPAAAQLRAGRHDSLEGRYQQIADMLCGDTVSTRVDGICWLRHLMISHPEQYQLAGMELLCAFVR